VRKIRDVLQLHHVAKLGRRAISRSLRLSPTTVGEYLRRAEAAGLSWPLPEGLDESALEQRLFPPAPMLPLAARSVPVWEAVHRELKVTKGMSLFLLWQEYKARAPEGFQYSWFCEQYRAWLGKLDLVMRQEHRAGEKCFVDYAGQTVAVMGFDEQWNRKCTQATRHRLVFQLKQRVDEILIDETAK
jgi:hypothetical protein